MTIDFAKLAAPFAPHEVEWRVGPMTQDKKRGIALAYVTARAVQDRFDDVCGPPNWQCRYSHAEVKTVCEIGIRVGQSFEPLMPGPDGSIGYLRDNWVWKADGAGDSDIEAAKGALSDAFKRAAVRWGVGRYLYDLPTPWVDLDQYKQITSGELHKLQHSLRLTTNTETATPPKDAPTNVPGTTLTLEQREVARQAYKRIANALNNATTAKLVDDILHLQIKDLELIGRAHHASEQALRDLAANRRQALAAEGGT